MLALAASAQWTVRESDFIGSPLQQIYKASPYLVHVVPDSVWDAGNFASKEDMRWYEDARYGMYIHFGLATFKNGDLSWGMADGVAPDQSKGAYTRQQWTSFPDSLRLENFSKAELTDIIRRSGMKYVMLVAKHHDGFHLYDTGYSDFKITARSPYGKDLVREVLDAARDAGAKVGIYFSQRDWYHPDYAPVDTADIDIIAEAPYYKAKEGHTVHEGKRHRRYVEYMFNTVRELCTKYGKLDMFNFDASYWNGMFTADMWDAERLTRMIRELQPGIIINNRAGLPGDYDSPEQRMGMYQDHRMWETCMCLCDTWSYSPTRVKTPEELFRNIQSAATGNGNILLSWGMHWDGSWDEKQKASLLATGKMLARYGESIYVTHGGPWMPDTWGGSTFRGDSIYLHVFGKDDATVNLPKIYGIEITAFDTLDGSKPRFVDKGSHYEVTTSKGNPQIIRLKADRKLTVDDIIYREAASSIFDNEANYGSKIAEVTLTPTDRGTINLQADKTVKGLRIASADANFIPEIRIMISNDGIDWQHYDTIKIRNAVTELPVARFVSGVLVEGVKARYIRLDGNDSQTGLTCSVYGE